MPPHLDSNSSAHVKRLGRLFWQHCQPCSRPPPLGPCSGLWKDRRPHCPAQASLAPQPGPVAGRGERERSKPSCLLPELGPQQQTRPHPSSLVTMVQPPVATEDSRVSSAELRERWMDRRTQREKAARRRGSMRKHQALWVQPALMGGVGGGGGAVSSHRPGQDGNTPLPFISMIHLTFPAVSPPALGRV